MSTLCLYYTRTNSTKEVIETIANAIGADIAEYTDDKDRSGIFGYIGACFAGINNSISKVHIKGNINFKEYDSVIIGMPIWAENPCAIGKAMIKKYCDEMPSKVYYVCTHMGSNDYLSKIKAMDKLLGRPSQGEYSIRTKKNDYVKDSKKIATFLSEN